MELSSDKNNENIVIAQAVENYENISVEKAVKNDEQNTETLYSTKIDEIRDTASNDVTYCGADHLNEVNILKGLIQYDNR